MDRRDFIRMTALAAGAVSFRGVSTLPVDGLYEVFRDPAGKYRPFVRWWWNGDKVTADELLRELDVLKAAGIGGMEINGRRIGVRWYGEHMYEITDALVKGENYVTIMLTTTLGNYMKTLEHNRAARAWMARSPYYLVGVERVMLRKGW